jgi:hypothetical protein
VGLRRSRAGHFRLFVSIGEEGVVFGLSQTKDREKIDFDLFKVFLNGYFRINFLKNSLSAVALGLHALGQRTFDRRTLLVGAPAHAYRLLAGDITAPQTLHRTPTARASCNVAGRRHSFGRHGVLQLEPLALGQHWTNAGARRVAVEEIFALAHGRRRLGHLDGHTLVEAWTEAPLLNVLAGFLVGLHAVGLHRFEADVS